MADDSEKIGENFNPRLREGGDPVAGIYSFLPDQISIHASEKEATDLRESASVTMTISIHASEKEATCHTFPTPPSRAISIHASEKEATTVLQY